MPSTAWHRQDPGAHRASSTCSITRRTSWALNGLTSRGRSTCAKKASASRTQHIPREKDDARQQARMAVLQLAVKSWPVQVGHAHVTQDHLIRARLQGRQALQTIGRRGNVVATALQETPQGPLHPGLIIDEQDGPALRLRRLPGSGAASGTWTSGAAAGRVTDTVVPWPGCTGQLDGAPMSLDNTAAQRQAQAAAHALRFGGKEGIEDAALQRRRDARPAVRHFQSHLAAVGMAAVVSRRCRGGAVCRRAWWALVRRFATT